LGPKGTKTLADRMSASDMATAQAASLFPAKTDLDGSVQDNPCVTTARSCANSVSNVPPLRTARATWDTFPEGPLWVDYGNLAPPFQAFAEQVMAP